MTTRGTPSGEVRGRALAGADAFLGIRYAAPPVGPLRWRAPVATGPWEGTYDATAFGPSAPQPVGGPLSGLVPGMAVGDQSEDCLTLNVWAPHGATGAPVMVWLHGGAFTLGGSSLPVYDGALLATEQSVVVVSVNYRLGALGWLTGLPGTDSNCGLRDQLLALRWVADHISSFGGDPALVTVFGESAGAGSVLHLLCSPDARGLLHRAIAQSPGAGQTLDPGRAGRVVEALLAEVGVADAEALRAVTADALLTAQTAVAAALLTDVGAMPFHPALDGDVLPAGPLSLGATGDLPLLTGTTSEEMRLFADPALSGLDLDTLASLLQPLLSAEARRPLALADVRVAVATYGAGVIPAGDAREVFASLATDQVMRLPLDQLMTQHTGPVYGYSFTWAATGAALDVGACHAADLPFPFGTVDVDGWGDWLGDPAQAAALSETVREAWASFARSGRPGAAALPPWPSYDDTRPTMELGRTTRLLHDPLAWAREACQPLSTPHQEVP